MNIYDAAKAAARSICAMFGTMDQYESEIAAHIAVEFAPLEAGLTEARKALFRATYHGIPGDWYCGSCGYELKVWICSGMTGPLPALCVLCRRGEDSAIASAHAKETQSNG
jgi:hypothetical protein